MSDKQQLIKKMIQMQKKFSAYEREHGLSPGTYYDPPVDHPLSAYRAEYDDLARQLIDLAHEERGSRR